MFAVAAVGSAYVIDVVCASCHSRMIATPILPGLYAASLFANLSGAELFDKDGDLHFWFVVAMIGISVTFWFIASFAAVQAHGRVLRRR